MGCLPLLTPRADGEAPRDMEVKQKGTGGRDEQEVGPCPLRDFTLWGRCGEKEGCGRSGKDDDCRWDGAGQEVGFS